VEIAALEKRNSDLEDETLQLMANLEELAAKTPEFESVVAKAKAEHASAQKDQQEHLAGLQTRLAEAKQLVEEKRALLPEDWLKPFQRLELTEGAEALASLNGRSCSACYTEVTAQQFALINSGRINACKTCGRLLYIPE
jgi:hypothetical protein